MTGKKKVPVKLDWREHVIDWVNTHRRDLPSGVSRPAAHAVIGMLMQSADSTGRNVMASARWLERETGVNHAGAAQFVLCLVKAGWLEFASTGLRGVPIYRLVPPPRRITPQSESANAEGTAEANAEDYSTTTDHRTSKKSTEERVSDECSNCERVSGHDADCPYREFVSLGDALENLKAGGVGYEEVVA